jgi:hypothetical protein
MPQYNLANFRESIKHVGRSQYFKVILPSEWSGDSTGGNVATALARSTSLPAVTHGTLEVPFRGLMMKIADRSEFAEWTVTYLCTEDHILRQNHIAWMHSAYIPSAQVNTRHEIYKTDEVIVYHLDSEHTPIYGYKFFGLFPSSVGEMSVTQEGGEFLTFDVTYTFDTFESGMGLVTDLKPNVEGTINADALSAVDPTNKISQLTEYSNASGVTPTQG